MDLVGHVPYLTKTTCHSRNPKTQSHSEPLRRTLTSNEHTITLSWHNEHSGFPPLLVAPLPSRWPFVILPQRHCLVAPLSRWPSFTVSRPPFARGEAATTTRDQEAGRTKARREKDASVMIETTKQTRPRRTSATDTTTISEMQPQADATKKRWCDG
ncbi:hypothetical protein SESBI_45842 [Sesbania bispinosa]|nr:hypothetical protein SESBI_45842 [Sesbania bispinosa]